MYVLKCHEYSLCNTVEMSVVIAVFAVGHKNLNVHNLAVFARKTMELTVTIMAIYDIDLAISNYVIFKSKYLIRTIHI